MSSDPNPNIAPAVRARLERERDKLAKEQASAERRAARIEALERGVSGLPSVVAMNRLRGLARNLHRSCLLITSDAVRELVEGLGAAEQHSSSVDLMARLRDAAIDLWTQRYEVRSAANAAHNDTLMPLGLERGEDGSVEMTEA